MAGQIDGCASEGRKADVTCGCSHTGYSCVLTTFVEDRQDYICRRDEGGRGIEGEMGRRQKRLDCVASGESGRQQEGVREIETHTWRTRPNSYSGSFQLSNFRACVGVAYRVRSTSLQNTQKKIQTGDFLKY